MFIFLSLDKIYRARSVEIFVTERTLNELLPELLKLYKINPDYTELRLRIKIKPVVFVVTQ